jgi:hypothetical protein
MSEFAARMNTPDATEILVLNVFLSLLVNLASNGVYDWAKELLKDGRARQVQSLRKSIASTEPVHLVLETHYLQVARDEAIQHARNLGIHQAEEFVDVVLATLRTHCNQ